MARGDFPSHRVAFEGHVVMEKRQLPLIHRDSCASAIDGTRTRTFKSLAIGDGCSKLENITYLQRIRVFR